MKSFQKTVLLTGGPMGGKTSFVTFARELIEGLNIRAQEEGSPREFRLLVQPEIATLLHSAGAALDGNPLCLDGFIVQELVSRLRREIAEGLETLGRAWLSEQEDRVFLLLLDRGALDPMAFEAHEFDTKSLCNKPSFMRGLIGVDAVFHLRSLAVDKPKAYSNATNKARTMDISFAAHIDQKLERIYHAACAWSKVPHHVFPNDTQKKGAITEKLLAILGEPPLEDLPPESLKDWS